MTWWNLTALNVHYETQPLPNALSWYIHQLPTWFHQCSAFLVFVIELAVPFCIFLNRRFKLGAFYSFNVLMILISLTGNYCFFNLLVMVISLFLVDDLHWQFLWNKLCPLKPIVLNWPRYERLKLRRMVTIGMVSVIIFLSFFSKCKSIDGYRLLAAFIKICLAMAIG